MLDKLANHYRVLLANVGSETKETFQFLLIRANVHRCTAKYIAGTHKDGETHLCHKRIDVLHRSKCTPFWLVYTDAVEHGRELVTVFGIVNTLSGSAEYVHLLGIETHGKVIRNLTSGGHDNTVRVLKFKDVHHPFKGKFVEIETVAHIVVGRHGFGIIVNHYTAPTLLTDRVQRLHTTPVELHAGADAISTRTKHNNGTMVAQVSDVILCAVICQIEIISLRRIFGSKGIYLLHHRKDAETFAIGTNFQNSLLAIHVVVQTECTGYLEIGKALSLRFS